MRKVTKSKTFNTVRQKNLVAAILREKVEMRPCTNCIKSGKRCIANRTRNKYTNCIKNTKTSYNLVVSQKNWDKLNNERLRLSKAIVIKRKKAAEAFQKIFRLKIF